MLFASWLRFLNPRPQRPIRRRRAIPLSLERLEDRTLLSSYVVTTLTATASPAVTLGTTAPTLSDVAVPAGGYYETGAITFTLDLGATQVYTTSDPVSGNGSYGASYTLPTTGTVTGTYTWHATYSGDSNNNEATDQGGTGEQTVVSAANATLKTTPNPTALTLGTTTRTLKDSAVLSGGYYDTGTITFTLYYGSTLVDTETATVSGNSTYTTPTGYTLPTTGTVTGTYQWDASYSGDTNNNGASDNNDPAEQVMVSKNSTTTTVRSSAGASTFGQQVTFTATVTGNAPGSVTPTGLVNFFDTTTNTDLGNANLSSGHATLTTASLPVGANVFTVSYLGDGNFLPSSTSTLTVTIQPSIFVLNATLSGALTLSGNASINIPGNVVVDSNATSALSESGNAQVTATSIQVVGNVQESGNATLTGTLTTGAPVLADPLAGLRAPDPNNLGLTNQGSVNLTRGSLTISQGIYGQIKVSGTGSLTLNPGIYLIEGGGFTVTGNASITGNNVLIYNAGSNFPGTGGTFGGITLSGNGTFSLTAAATGPYAGVVIYQARDNTRALSLSGSASTGIHGVIYAANALLTLSGNAQLQAPLVVGTLNLSGNVGLTQMAAGSDGMGDTSGIADTLLAGDLTVYVNNSNGYFTADELARIQDAIAGLDTLLAPYHVTITEISDSTSANLVLDAGTTSAGAVCDVGPPTAGPEPEQVDRRRPTPVASASAVRNPNRAVAAAEDRQERTLSASAAAGWWPGGTAAARYAGDGGQGRSGRLRLGHFFLQHFGYR